MYQWSRPIPTSLKIIHSRVYAQVHSYSAVLHVRAIRRPQIAGSVHVSSPMEPEPSALEVLH